MIAPLADEVRGRLGDVVFTVDDEALEAGGARGCCARSGARSRARSRSPGGAWARGMTPAEGASAVFVGSAVVYTADAKQRVLGVSATTIEGPGVVSRRCALEMAAGARRLFGADVAVSLTGAAGPGAARRRRARERCGSASTPTTCTTRVGTGRRASASGSAGGPSRRRSISCAATSRACRSPTATG